MCSLPHKRATPSPSNKTVDMISTALPSCPPDFAELVTTRLYYVKVISHHNEGWVTFSSLFYRLSYLVYSVISPKNFLCHRMKIALSCRKTSYIHTLIEYTSIWFTPDLWIILILRASWSRWKINVFISYSLISSSIILSFLESIKRYISFSSCKYISFSF